MSNSNSPSPVPTGAGGTGGSPAAAAAAGGGEDWRGLVQQSYRNTEVREIAKVLATLESTSTSTKLRLAMQFEDAVFKSATSLSDYRKRLTKRLKKVQKSYKTTAAAASPTATSKTTATDGGGGAAGSAGANENTLKQLLELRRKYGTVLRYILKHSDAAIEAMKTKHGADKAATLKQHTNGVKSWATDLGIPIDTDDDNKNKNEATTVSTTASATTTSTNQNYQYLPPNSSMSPDQLEKLRQQLEKRVENIRCHVVKLADPDTFLLETLEKTERDMGGGSGGDGSAPDDAVKQRQQKKAGQLLAVNSKKRYEQLQRMASGTLNATEMLEGALKGISQQIPPLTRTKQLDQQEKDAALIQLSKMRAASSLALAWMMTSDKSSLQTESKYKNLLQRAHSTACEGTDFVVDVMAKRRGNDKEETAVKLEDAWTKAIELPAAVAAVDTIAEQTSVTAPGAQQPRQNRRRPVIRTRVLLTPHRKPPVNLLPTLKRKCARLVRPPPYGEGSHLVLEFGKAFTMTIYFCPLVVTLRAYNNKGKKRKRPGDGDGSSIINTATTDTVMGTCATLTPLCDGLTRDGGNDDDDDDDDDNGIGTTTTVTPPPPGSTDGRRKQKDHNADNELTVWGTTGTYNQIGYVVEERLRDASCQCTCALRRCFENMNMKLAPTANDFEIEIREATALLEFIQLALTTYIPDWQDHEE